jgi:hypothetical protein
MVGWGAGLMENPIPLAILQQRDTKEPSMHQFVQVLAERAWSMIPNKIMSRNYPKQVNWMSG